MTDFSTNLFWQKSHPKIKLTYKLDYNPESIWIIPANNDEQEDFPFFVQEIGLTKAQKNYYVHRENLESYIICYVNKGVGIVTYNGRSQKVNPGDAFWLDCRKPHSYYTAAESGYWEVYFIHCYGPGVTIYSNCFFKYKPNCILSIDKDSVLPQYFEKLLSLFQNRDSEIMTKIIASTYLCNLCFVLVEEAKSSEENQSPSYIQSISNYIKFNFNKQINLEILSEEFFISKFYLQRQFKKYIGVSPNQYLTNIRISWAKKYLRTTSDSINKIASAIGFNDPSYFTVTFKNIEGITPLMYRKIWAPKKLD